MKIGMRRRAVPSASPPVPLSMIGRGGNSFGVRAGGEPRLAVSRLKPRLGCLSLKRRWVRVPPGGFGARGVTAPGGFSRHQPSRGFSREKARRLLPGKDSVAARRPAVSGTSVHDRGMSPPPPRIADHFPCPSDSIHRGDRMRLRLRQERLGRCRMEHAKAMSSGAENPRLPSSIADSRGATLSARSSSGTSARRRMHH